MMARKIITFSIGFILLVIFIYLSWMGYVDGWQLSVLLVSLGIFLLIIYNLDYPRTRLRENRKMLAEMREIQADL
jgi:Ca2+/Na+ antiporter